MSRIHDMGGRFGDGAVTPDFGQEPVFKEEWHGRALALTLASGFLGQWTLDEGRHMRESLSPNDYMRFSYYEKWLAGLANLLVEKGVVSRDELETGSISPATEALLARVIKAEDVPARLSKGGPTERDVGPKALFAVGDSVKTHSAGNTTVPGGHTRLPIYAAGKTGRIVAIHGNHVFPDTNAHQAGEAPEPLYTVAFKANELWKHPDGPKDLVMLDLWQSYLAPL